DLPEPISPVSKPFLPSNCSVHTRPSKVPQLNTSSRVSRKPDSVSSAQKSRSSDCGLFMAHLHVCHPTGSLRLCKSSFLPISHGQHLPWCCSPPPTETDTWPGAYQIRPTIGRRQRLSESAAPRKWLARPPCHRRV